MVFISIYENVIFRQKLFFRGISYPMGKFQYYWKKCHGFKNLGFSRNPKNEKKMSETEKNKNPYWLKIKKPLTLTKNRKTLNLQDFNQSKSCV